MNRTGARISDGGSCEYTCHDLCLHGEHGKLPLEALPGPDNRGLLCACIEQLILWLFASSQLRQRLASASDPHA